MWILVYHIHEQLWLSIPVVSKIIGTGNMAVDIFLVLSAVGLSYSVEKNDKKTFYINRLKRTFVTYLLIAGPFIAWKYFIAQDITAMTAPNFVLELSTLSYFWTKEGVFPFWYVPCILLFYAFYPLLYRLYRKNKFYILGLIVLSVIFEMLLMFVESPIITLTERTFSRIPIFLIGILISDSVKQEKKISSGCVVASFVVLVFTLIVYPVIQLYKYNTVCVRYIYGVMAISLLIAGAFIMELIGKLKVTRFFIKIFSYLGGASLEIYLAHVAILKILMHYNVQQKVGIGRFYILFIVFGVLLGIAFRKLLSYIIKHKKVNNNI